MRSGSLTRGRFWALAIPYGWLALFFLAPLALVAKISLSKSVIAQPPYEPVFDLAQGPTGWLEQAQKFALTAYRGLTATMKYGQPGPEGSLTKLMWSSTNQQLMQAATDILGPEALLTDSPWSFDLLRSRGNTIEGGTTEILKNIVAERVLGLPRMR